MIFLDLPTINGSGTTEQQLSEIRSYIYKNNEQINTALSNLTIDKIWEQTASAVSSANQSEDETPKILKQYQRIRDLIIKTADVVAQSDEKMEMAFNGSYLAKSQFGEYFKQTKVEIEGTPVGINELYDYSTKLETGLETYKLDYECYIKRGLLTDATNPIYGIELGVLKDTIILYDEHGEPVNHNLESNKHFKTRITPDKWSFYQGNTEVAYIDANAIHFPAAQITGGSIDIGNGTFHVDSTGEMTATSGTFGGTLDASELSIKNSVKEAWNNVSGEKIKLSSTALTIYDNSEIDFLLNPKSITFYKHDTIRDVDAPMTELKRESFTNNSHWGLALELKVNYGDYFRLCCESKTGVTYVPPGVLSGSNIYNTEGIYINAPLAVHSQPGGTLYNAVANKTITIPTAYVNGVQTSNVVINIVNGLIVEAI